MCAGPQLAPFSLWRDMVQQGIQQSQPGDRHHFEWAGSYAFPVCMDAALADPAPGKTKQPFFLNEQTPYCVRALDRYHEPKDCPQYGHPISPLTGNKSLAQSLGIQIGGQAITLNYSSRRKLPANDSTLVFDAVPAASVGELWSTNLHKRLVFQSSYYIYPQTVQASRGMGRWISFVRDKTGNDSAGNYIADATAADQLLNVSGAWRYVDASARSEETYDAVGLLQAASYADGNALSYTYSDSNTAPEVAPRSGLLVKVQDQVGRSVQFLYEQPSGMEPRIRQIVDPAGQVIGVQYGAGNNLSQLTWPDGKTLKYLYERTDIPWALTGVIDENDKRLATYGYDTDGRAVDTQWAGGADHFSATYATPPRWNIVDTADSAANVVWRDHYWELPQGVVVTKPDGSSISIGATLINGTPYLTSQSQPAGSGCAASTRGQMLDANGNVIQSDDFNGFRTCYASDPGRHLETTRIEGLAYAQVCAAVTPAGSVLPPGSRRISTAWHPDWKLQTRVAGPGKLTTNVYNGQPDPFNGGAAAACAPATSVLADGKPIAVLCKKVEQATTDADGHLGVNAALQAGVSARQSTWTYNAYGQVLSARGPRADVDDTTVYTYYSDTTADHSLGDLQSVTDPLGHVTRYTKYNRLGRWLESVDPNGVVTANTYDLRQRLTSTTVAGETTSYTYDPAGQLTTVTPPTGATITYTYDDAQRLRQVTDAAGNKTTYTLDGLGNRIGEQVVDANGNVVRNVVRQYDALNRLQSVTEGAR